jgi:thioredoxin 1
MLASTSRHARCDVAAKHNTYAAARVIPCMPLIKPSASAHHLECSSVAAQQRCSVVLRSAESTTTVTTAAPAAAPSTAPALLELNKDTFQPFLDAAGDKLVVVDFFTDWCGPCKLILPQLIELSAELEPKATIVKFNCNQYNKELAKGLGIKVAPTFHLYKHGQKVADMTGAKVDKLRALIDDHLKPQEAAGGEN